ncbi:putative TIM-barrel fold metal-dependent hydrolase [Paraburkholderia unamae]|uniref:amidohydrolase family protein n=1 Tax=Paraburkholderia unamae TaxID=219649 RepID=UPI000DC3D18D|nr:amidohydrolase family protein [Paraburkholderia unamae]RAR55368.1 putative TIM-barrel fold metal-dependent hydrolase [Paraburkholderia unamae]
MYRRNLLGASLAAMGGLALSSACSGASAFGGTASSPATSPLDVPSLPASTLPSGSCDCHVHIFDAERYPFAAGRSYTPGRAVVSDLLGFEGRLGIERVVVVQPSVYGTDNSALLAALKELGTYRARGVAVIDPQVITDSELRSLNDHGVRGVRLNLEVKGQRDHTVALAQLKHAAQTVAPLGWSIQIYADVDVVAAMAPTIATLPVSVILDHFAGVRVARQPEQQDAFDTVLQLVKDGNVYVKLSAPYRASAQGPDFADIAPFAQQLISARPDRMLWASDWPHTGSASHRDGDLTRVEPFRKEDAGRALNNVLSWAETNSVRQQILVDNPARLYGFAAQAS